MKKYLPPLLFALLVMALGFATPEPPYRQSPVSRYQLLTAETAVYPGGSSSATVHVILKLDTVTGRTWRYHWAKDPNAERLTESWIEIADPTQQERDKFVSWAIRHPDGGVPDSDESGTNQIRFTSQQVSEMLSNTLRESSWFYHPFDPQFQYAPPPR
jgi:hypothetical protein